MDWAAAAADASRHTIQCVHLMFFIIIIILHMRYATHFKNVQLKRDPMTMCLSLCACACVWRVALSYAIDILLLFYPCETYECVRVYMYR